VAKTRIFQMGLLRSVRDLWRQYRSFGDRELEVLRQQVLANRDTLLKVKEIQETNSKLAEAAVLNALKDTVDEMRTIREQAAVDSTAARLSLKELEQKLEREMAVSEKLATVDLLKNVNIAKLMGTGDPDKSDTGEEEIQQEDRNKG
jgi:uncharacterized protein YaaW (UPF0174 family)